MIESNRQTLRRDPASRSAGAERELGGRRPHRAARRLGVAVSAALLLGSAACGFNAQTLMPYTPAAGVNVNVGTGPNQEPVTSTVQVRGLMVISRTPGEGFLSASLLCGDQDALTSVSGYVVKTDGSQGSALTVTLPEPVALGNNQLVVLTDRTEIAVASADLMAGGTVSLTLTFSNAGSQQVLAPVVDGNTSGYSSVSPSPAPSGSPSS